jgi:hypothetical protein
MTEDDFSYSLIFEGLYKYQILLSTRRSVAWVNEEDNKVISCLLIKFLPNLPSFIQANFVIMVQMFWLLQIMNFSVHKFR